MSHTALLSLVVSFIVISNAEAAAAQATARSPILFSKLNCIMYINFRFSRL